MNKKLFIGLIAIAGLAGCKDGNYTAEPAAPESNAIQAYVYANTSNVTMKPGENDSLIIYWAGDSIISQEKKFPVLIGRRICYEAIKLPLQITDETGSFEWNDTIDFAYGESMDTLWISTNLDFGQSAYLTIGIPNKYSTYYGLSEQTIKVLVDYTWLPAGSVTMSSDWEGASAVVAIERAKEFSNAAGDTLYRLNSPYYHISPEYCTEEGYHLMFTLDKEYNAVDLIGGPYIAMEYSDENGEYGYAWDTEEYPEESFTNNTNSFVISTYWDGYVDYGLYTESFVWDKDYPGIQ